MFFYTFVSAIMSLVPVLAFSWHLLSITSTKKVTNSDGTPLRLEMENEVMSKRSTPNIYNLWLFYNFLKLCKKKRVVRYSIYYESLLKAYRGISLWIMHWMMQIALWCGRYAASVVEPRWKMERGDIWFSQVHAPDGMNTFEGPSSGAPYTF